MEPAPGLCSMGAPHDTLKMWRIGEGRLQKLALEGLLNPSGLERLYSKSASYRYVQVRATQVLVFTPSFFTVSLTCCPSYHRRGISISIVIHVCKH